MSVIIVLFILSVITNILLAVVLCIVMSKGLNDIPIKSVSMEDGCKRCSIHQCQTCLNHLDPGIYIKR